MSRRIKPTKIDLVFPENTLLQNLEISEEFNIFIVKEALNILKQTIKLKKKKCVLFEIVNLNYKIVLNQSQFIPLLNKGIALYEKLEDFESCNELLKLKNEYENVQVLPKK